jgi:hypothetical protein
MPEADEAHRSNSYSITSRTATSIDVGIIGPFSR